MFAFLALAGDLGATVSPTMVGSLSEKAGGDLKAGLLAATMFPVILVVGLIVLRTVKKHQIVDEKRTALNWQTSGSQQSKS